MLSVPPQTPAGGQVQADRDLAVLDVGGVLFTDVATKLIHNIAKATSRSEEAVTDVYRILARRLWCGLISTDQFWQALGHSLARDLDSSSWDEEGVRTQTPLLSQDCLNSLLAKCDVALLTNNRKEWLAPALKRAGLSGSFSPVVISSVEECMKPDPMIYARLERRLRRRYKRKLFVDDKMANLKPAEKLGYQVILADPASDWERKLAEWISMRSN
jgi:FMN phosphatase YigB (HAD superfamily)